MKQGITSTGGIIIIVILVGTIGVALIYLSSPEQQPQDKSIQIVSGSERKNIVSSLNTGTAPVGFNELRVQVNGIDAPIVNTEVVIEPGESGTLEFNFPVFGDNLNVVITGPSNEISYTVDISPLQTTEETCSDGEQNQDETDVDCGGAICGRCPNLKNCLTDNDCISGNCTSNFCIPFDSTEETCEDGTQNQDETDVDCGGSCPGCVAGQQCIQNSDCISLNCISGICQSPVLACSDMEGIICDADEVCSIDTIPTLDGDCCFGTCEPIGECTDTDDDNYFAEEDCGTEVDCDDTDPNVNPGEIEVCDEIDNNCDGDVDEDNVCNLLELQNTEVFFVDSMHKVYWDDVQDEYWMNDAPNLEAARNEYESFQIILEPLAGGMTNSLSISDLSNGIDTIPNSSFQFYKVESTRTKMCTGIGENFDPHYSHSGDPTSQWYGCSNTHLDHFIHVPDPLWPLKDSDLSNLDLNTSENNVYWITIYIPQGITPGDYTGVITVSEAAGGRSNFSLSLRVFDFELPADSSLPAGYSILSSSGDNYPSLRFYNVTNLDWKSVSLNYYEKMNSYRLSPANFKAFFLSNLKDNCTLTKDDAQCVGCCNGTLTCDFSQVKDSLDYFTSLGFSFSDIRVQTSPIKWNQWRCNPHNESQRSAIMDLTEQFYTQLGAELSDYQGRLVAQIYNEPNPIYCNGTESGYTCIGGEWLIDETVRWSVTEYPEAIEDSGIRSLLTMGGKWHKTYLGNRGMWTDTFIEDFFNGARAVDVWIAHYKSTLSDSWYFWQSLIDEGESVGSYNCCNHHWSPHVINQPSMMPRIWRWLVWRFNLTHTREWDRTWWWGYRENASSSYNDTGIDYSIYPYRNPWSNTDCPHGPGTCEFFYPPCKEGFCSDLDDPEILTRVVPSIRLENIRDGMEDYEYFYLLNQLDSSNPVLDRLAEVAPGFDETDWKRYLVMSDSSLVLEIRREIAEQIESLSSRTTPPHTPF